jgi:hypothetical protein
MADGDMVSNARPLSAQAYGNQSAKSLGEFRQLLTAGNDTMRIAEIDWALFCQRCIARIRLRGIVGARAGFSPTMR